MAQSVRSVGSTRCDKLSHSLPRRTAPQLTAITQRAAQLAVAQALSSSNAAPPPSCLPPSSPSSQHHHSMGWSAVLLSALRGPNLPAPRGLRWLSSLPAGPAASNPSCRLKHWPHWWHGLQLLPLPFRWPPSTPPFSVSLPLQLPLVSL